MAPVIQSFCLTLLDRVQDVQGRVIFQLANHGGDGPIPRGRSLDTHDCDTSHLQNQEQVMDTLSDIEFLQWGLDRISCQLSDFSTAFLDLATHQHPSVLNFLSLDISQLSRISFASVQNILGQSSLEYLAIMCTPFDLTMSESISKVLGFIPWLTLKSLVLSGDNINEWIRRWPLPPVSPQLMHLQIQGVGSAGQELSHSSALFVHKVVYVNLLMELHLEHIQFEDTRDWELIVESMDPTLLKTLCLGL